MNPSSGVWRAFSAFAVGTSIRNAVKTGTSAFAINSYTDFPGVFALAWTSPEWTCRVFSRVPALAAIFLVSAIAATSPFRWAAFALGGSFSSFNFVSCRSISDNCQRSARASLTEAAVTGNAFHSSCCSV